MAEVEDFVDFLAEKDSPVSEDERALRIAAFAREYGGTAYDLDPDLKT